MEAAAMGGERKRLEPLLPFATPIGRQHRLHLACWHGVGIRAQARQNGSHLGRQQVACVHRNQLPDLHRCAPHLCQLLGDLEGVGGGQQEVTDFGAFALRKLPGTRQQHIARHTGGHLTHAHQATQAATGHDRAHRGRHGHQGWWTKELSSTNIMATPKTVQTHNRQGCDSPEITAHQPMPLLPWRVYTQAQQYALLAPKTPP
jgi:hypothetical protein